MRLMFLSQDSVVSLSRGTDSESVLMVPGVILHYLCLSKNLGNTGLEPVTSRM